MLIYTVKLINPETKEVYFEHAGERPLLPSEEDMKKHQGALLIINTGSSLPQEKTKAA